MRKYAPIALFAFNRPKHARRVVEALLKNAESAGSELFVFSDGPKSEDDASLVQEVRQYAESIKGFTHVELIRRNENIGLAQNIISGITEVLSHHDRIIVVEDDMLVSPFFLRFINESLDVYEHDERIISVHGYMYPVAGKLPGTFFLRGANCWGWGTWKRGWALFEPDGKKLLAQLHQRNLCRQFDMDGTYPYTKMLEDQIAGKNQSWAVRWYASAFLHDKLTLYPGESLVQNIGNDRSGTHVGRTTVLDVVLRTHPLVPSVIPVEEHRGARAQVAEFFRYLPLTRLQRVLSLFGIKMKGKIR